MTADKNENTPSLADFDQLACQLMAVPGSPKEVVASPEFSERYIELTNALASLQELKKNVDGMIKDVLREQYYENGENSIVTPECRYTYVPVGTRETFDSKALKVADPETYCRYVKVAQVSDSIRITKNRTDDAQ